MNVKWVDSQHNVAHQNLFDSVCDIIKRKWKIGKIAIKDVVHKAIAANEFNQKKNNCIHRMEDVYSPLFEAELNHNTVTIYVTCLCGGNQKCPKTFRILHHHRGLCTIQHSPKEHVGKECIEALPIHPSVTFYLKRNQSTPPDEALQVIDEMRLGKNLPKEDGRYNIPASKIINKRKKKAKDEQLTYKTIKDNPDCTFLSKEFDPADFAIVVCDIDFLKQTADLENFGFYVWDGWWKNTPYDVCFYALVTVDDYGTGQVVFLAFTARGNQEGVKQVL